MTPYLAIYCGNHIIKYCETLREAHNFLIDRDLMDNDDIRVVPVR